MADPAEKIATKETEYDPTAAKGQVLYDDSLPDPPALFATAGIVVVLAIIIGVAWLTVPKGDPGPRYYINTTDTGYHSETLEDLGDRYQLDDGEVVFKAHVVGIRDQGVSDD